MITGLLFFSLLALTWGAYIMNNGLLFVAGMLACISLAAATLLLESYD